MFGTAADELRRVRLAGWKPEDRVFPEMPKACNWFDDDLKQAWIVKLDARGRIACSTVCARPTTPCSSACVTPT